MNKQTEEKIRKELKENLYDTIRINNALSFDINGFEVKALNMIRITGKFKLRVAVYKDDTQVFFKEYDIDGVRIKNRFFKKSLCEFDMKVIDTIMEDLLKIIPLDKWLPIIIKN